MKVKRFDDKNVRLQFDAELVKALAPFAKAHGMSVRIVGGMYTDGTWTPKVEFAITARAVSEFVEFSGLKAEHLGMEFTYRGETYKIVGAHPGSKYSVRATLNSTGREAGFTSESVKESLKFPNESEAERRARHTKEDEERRAAWAAKRAAGEPLFRTEARA